MIQTEWRDPSTHHRTPNDRHPVPYWSKQPAWTICSSSIGTIALRICHTGFILGSKPSVLLLLIAAVGGTLRIYSLDGRSLWLDEAYTLLFASQSISKIVTNTVETTPPLYYLIVHAWISLFGTSEWALRSLSVIFGTAAIFFIGLLGMFLYDRRTGMLAALLMAVMVFPLHYAREARAYSLFLSMTLASSYFCLKSLEGGSTRHWLGYLCFTVGLAYTHNYWVFLVFAQNLYVLLFYWSDKPVLVRWIGAQAGVLLCFLPWLTPLLEQTNLVIEKGLSIPRPDISSLGKVLARHVTFLAYSEILWGYMLICILGALEIRRVKGPWRWQVVRQSLDSYRWQVNLSNVQRSSFLFLWFVCPVLLPFLLSQFFTPIFWPRYTICAIPALYLLIARGVWQVPTMSLRRLVISAIILSSLANLHYYYAFSESGISWKGKAKYFKYDWEPWRDWLAFLKQRVELTDVIFVSPASSALLVDYYAKNSFGYHILPAIVNDENLARVESSIDTLVLGKRRLWLVFRTPTRRRGLSTVEFLHNRYQRIAVEPIVKLESNITLFLFDLGEHG
jgi:mannosyltransferase